MRRDVNAVADEEGQIADGVAMRFGLSDGPDRKWFNSDSSQEWAHFGPKGG
jgi:hypothetical protein